MSLLREAKPVVLVVIASVLAGLGALAGPVTGARADGDPASDVLTGTPVFLAPDSGASVEQQAQLLAQTRRTVKLGQPLRVAVIASRSDLGSIGALWLAPETYARFLGRELSLVYHGELLVVMPDGFGVSRDGVAVGSPLNGLAPRHDELVTAAEQAVAKLTGVPAVASVSVSALRTRSITSGLGWWLATGIGVAALIALWTVSLKRLPVRMRKRDVVLTGGHD